MRILDIDIDFFVQGAAHWRSRDDGRLNADEYPPWETEDVLRFIEIQCGLTDPLPGIAVEYHGELFWEWRNAIDRGDLQQPFSVTHVDAHADLGLGDAGYMYLMTDLLFRDVNERIAPEMSPNRLWDGNFLAFAIACHWVSDLTYVYNDGGGGDLLAPHMKDFNLEATTIQLKAVDAATMRGGLGNYERITPAHLEPEVPFARLHWSEYQADEPFDVVCLTRSPNFTPSETDALFDLIRHRFVDEWAQ